MTRTTTTPSTTGRAPRRTPGPAPATPRQGWWGIGFAGLLLISEAAVSLPRDDRSAAFVHVFYAEHRGPIVAAQVGQLLSILLFWQFARALTRRAPVPSARPLLGTAGLVAAAAVATSVAVLVLALVPGLTLGATGGWARATVLTDVVLSVAIAAFATACAASAATTWLRLAAGAVAVLSLAEAALSLAQVTWLEAVAPLAFLLLVVALSVRMLRERDGATS
jgi:hypothetical protein